MIRTRRFEIVSNDTKGLSMKVAFASTDKVHVNEHFGRAEQFYIWDIGPEEAAFSGLIQVKAERYSGASRPMTTGSLDPGHTTSASSRVIAPAIGPKGTPAMGPS